MPHHCIGWGPGNQAAPSTDFSPKHKHLCLTIKTSMPQPPPTILSLSWNPSFGFYFYFYVDPYRRTSLVAPLSYHFSSSLAAGELQTMEWGCAFLYPDLSLTSGLLFSDQGLCCPCSNSAGIFSSNRAPCPLGPHPFHHPMDVTFFVCSGTLLHVLCLGAFRVF